MANIRLFGQGTKAFDNKLQLWRQLKVDGASQVPVSELGSPVPAIIGRQWVRNPNTIWTGDMRYTYQAMLYDVVTREFYEGELGEVSSVSSTGTSSGVARVVKQILIANAQLAICLGPDVRLRGISANNTQVWAGNIGPGRTSLTLPEGTTGLSEAVLSFSGGALDQTPDPFFTDPGTPGYCGVATLSIRNLQLGLPIAELMTDVERFPNPLALSSGNNRLGDDINIITAIIDVLTNEWGFGSLSINMLDLDRFRTLANQAAGYGNAVSFTIDKEMAQSDLVKVLLKQAGIVLFWDIAKGKISANPRLTEVVNYEDIKYHVNASDILDFRNWSKSGWSSSINQARGIFVDRATGVDLPVFNQNPANISDTGKGKNTVTFDYPFVNNRTLAAKLLARDLAQVCAPTFSFELTTNRKGSLFNPGDMITVTYGEYSLYSEPVFIRKVRQQEMKFNTVVLQCEQARFPSPESLYGEGAASFDPGFDLSAKVPTSVMFDTAPYHIARARAGLTAAQVTPLVHAMIFPNPANAMQTNFNAAITNSPQGAEIAAITNGAYPTRARLSQDVGTTGILDGYDNGIMEELLIKEVVNPAQLHNIGNGGVRAGQLFMFIDNEILSFESCENLGNNQWKLSKVHRALLDTCPQPHTINTELNIIGNDFSCVANSFPYPLPYTPAWAISSNSLYVGGGAVGRLYSSAWHPSAARLLCPPRPHMTSIYSANNRVPTNIVAISPTLRCDIHYKTRARTRQDVALSMDAPDGAEINGGNRQLHRGFLKDSFGTTYDVGTSTSNIISFMVNPAMKTGMCEIWVQAELTINGTIYKSLNNERIIAEILP